MVRCRARPFPEKGRAHFILIFVEFHLFPTIEALRAGNRITGSGFDRLTLHYQLYS
jgi:hypothetical protein